MNPEPVNVSTSPPLMLSSSNGVTLEMTNGIVSTGVEGSTGIDPF